MLIRELWFPHIWILRFNRQEGPYRAFLPVRPAQRVKCNEQEGFGRETSFVLPALWIRRMSGMAHGAGWRTGA